MTIRDVIEALRAGPQVMLATIIATSGSTPAAALSKMMVRDGGTSWAGTVGGGCMEADVLEAAIRLQRTGGAAILKFQLTEDDIPRGLICGGSLDILIEPLTRSDLPFLQNLDTRLSGGEDCVIGRVLMEGAVHTRFLIGRGDIDQVSRNLPAGSHPDSVRVGTEVRAAFDRTMTRRVRLDNAELILEPAASSPTLILFGGGHVSLHLSRVATMAGFRVTVVDDRREYANPERFPEAWRTLVTEFEGATGAVRITERTCIVIVTRGHRYDEVVLAGALRSPAAYIGMIGSRRKVLATFDRLVADGLPPALLTRVNAPMGLAIGAATAEEIAISIVAELINVRRGNTGTGEPKSREIQTMLADRYRSAASSS